MPTPTNDEIDARIEAWHTTKGPVVPLHLALGWTKDEYVAWLQNSSSVPDRPLPTWPDAALTRSKR